MWLLFLYRYGQQVDQNQVPISNVYNFPPHNNLQYSNQTPQQAYNHSAGSVFVPPGAQGNPYSKAYSQSTPNQYMQR